MMVVEGVELDVDSGSLARSTTFAVTGQVPILR
jgi:hypothetical protein